MSAIAHALADKDFLGASPDDQKAYLSSIDSDFAGAKPEDQNAYLNHILAPGRQKKAATETEFEKERKPENQQGVVSTAWQDIKGAGKGLASTLSSVFDQNEIKPVNGVLPTPKAMQVKKMGEEMDLRAAESERRKQAGYGLPYRIAANVAENITPLNVRGVEESADVGNLRGIAGHALAAETLSSVPEAAGRLTRIPNPVTSLSRVASERPAVAKLILGNDRAAALQELAPTDIPTKQSPGGPLPSIEDFYKRKGADIMRRGAAEDRLSRAQARTLPKIEPAKPDPFAGATSSAKPVGNAKLPPVGSVQLPKVIPQAEPITAIEVPSEEGARGSLPKPSGRLVLLPEEARAVDRLQNIAKRRASEHGMQYAAGMRPAGGGRVPFTPTGTMTSEFGGPRTLQPIEQTAPKQLPAPKERPQIAYKGGINEKGVEESIRPISQEQSISGLSGEIERMKEKLRNANGAPESEKAALQQQIDEYQGRLDELRKAKK